MPIIHILRYEPIKKDALIKLVGGYSNYSNEILIILVTNKSTYVSIPFVLNGSIFLVTGSLTPG